MKRGKFKRSAGQRRYLALKKRSDNSRYILESLQRTMQSYDAEGKQARQLHIMQEITKAIEGMKS